jgi:class 3 adenylate cyclase/tetratricopeptide (TPR) repeat protein
MDDATYLARLQQQPQSLTILLALCKELEETGPLHTRTVDLRIALAESLLAFGDPIRAHDVLTPPLRERDEHPTEPQARLTQLRALSLARSGATRLAKDVIERLVDHGDDTSETLGIYARVHRDLGACEPNPRARRDYYRRALELYEKAVRNPTNSASTWTLLYAAVMALLLRQRPKATQYALEAEKQSELALRQQTHNHEDTYWSLSNLGLACIILDKLQEAHTWLAQAAHVANDRYGNMSSTRSYVRLLAETLDHDSRSLDQLLPLPNVVVFAGHMIDAKNRPLPRFPNRIRTHVERAITARLEKLNARIGFSSAACGSDILFLEAMQRAGHENHIVLPYDRERFINDSINPRDDGGEWEKRFQLVTGAATEVIIATPQPLRLGGVSYKYGNRLLHGLASIKARQLDTELKYLAVWDLQPAGDGPGGTADTVKYWRDHGLTRPVEIININELRDGVPHPQPRDSETNAALSGKHADVLPSDQTLDMTSGVGATVAALLFADVARFSKLREEQILPFVTHFLGLIRDEIDTLERRMRNPRRRTTRSPILKKNTWGDGLYIAFNSVRTAGIFALNLCTKVAEASWSRLKLPHDLNIRIGLHAGPVVACHDPVTALQNYMGTHVSHAARIEPIVPDGEVYVSREFAALAEAEGVTEFSCHYAGQAEYAKKYGIFPIYRLEPASKLRKFSPT